MVHLLAVDAASWPGPAGWLFRNTPGNLAASGIAFGAGLVVGRRPWKRVKAHNRWMALQLAHVHLAATGVHAEPHPEHGALTGNHDDIPAPPPYQPDVSLITEVERGFR